MSTTPRTDAESNGYYTDIDCARQLELELLAARAELTLLRADLSVIRGELDSTCNAEELRQVRAELAEAKKDTVLLNELADCYFTRRCEGLLELMMRADRRTQPEK